ncbi:ATP-binding protein [Streptomyces sp. ISL-96]|uniref:ATP-binding protein n=1 Tax=Streptomyces sp. ISL-96 TaxID=2819191 RepID=UPI001BEB15C8|nr:ATP-binding protein [Streptomyces sp. ISL-96]MBT2487410.1 ATP-binding protein [Streptomyces sp. ISL-96]
MKQSAAKTLGVAALGAAFAAAAAGSASAAPALPAVPDLTGTLSSVTTTLPVQDVVTKLPGGAPEALAGAQNALTGAATTLPAALGEATSKATPSGEKGGPRSADPVKGLLGGLPTGGLPAGSLPGLGG